MDAKPGKEMDVKPPVDASQVPHGDADHVPNGDVYAADDEKLRYGWFGYTPGYLQWMNTAKMFCLLMTVVNIFHVGVSAGLIGVIQSSIERRFRFSASQLSWIVVTYDIISVPVSVFITWLGTVGCHRPRWVTLSVSSSAIGCLLYALPHFITTEYNPGGIDGGDEDFLCSNRTGIDLCEDQEDEGSEYGIVIFCMILSRFFLGFAGGGLYTLGFTFLDDSLTKSKFSLYSSMIALGGVLGPALGFIAGGMFLQLYTEWPHISGDDVGLEPSDPRWVGAWWLPLLVFGGFITVLIVPFSGYPHDLPGAAAIRDAKVSEAYDVTKDEIPPDPRNIDFTRHDIIPYTKSLLTNATFLFLTLYICCDMSILSAFTVFIVKYVEVQFALSSSQAGALVGIVLVPAGVIGAVGGGVVIDKFQLSIKQIMKVEGVVAFLVLFSAVQFWVWCDQSDFAGVNVPYYNTTSLDLLAPCNMGCDCDDLPYSPVCSHDDVQYFSPCHAGCADRIEDEQGMQFYNCSCVPEPEMAGDPQGAWNICGSQGNCGLWVFVLFNFLGCCGMFMAEAMNISSVIRSIPNKQRVFGMFISGIIVRFVGSTPGPVLMAACFDAACTLWQETCDKQGSCFYYDSTRLGGLTFAYAFFTKVASVVFMFLAYVLYKPPRLEVLRETTVDAGEEDAEGATVTRF